MLEGDFGVTDIDATYAAGAGYGGGCGCGRCAAGRGCCRHYIRRLRPDQRALIDRARHQANVAHTAHASADIKSSDGTGEITGAGTPSQRADKAEIGSGLIQVEIPDLLAVRIEITADVGNVEAGCAAQADVPAKLELEISAVGIAQIVLQVLSRGETVKAIRICSPKHG